jgi:CHAT domain-containing protein
MVFVLVVVPSIFFACTQPKDYHLGNNCRDCSQLITDLNQLVFENENYPEALSLINLIGPDVRNIRGINSALDIHIRYFEAVAHSRLQNYVRSEEIFFDIDIALRRNLELDVNSFREGLYIERIQSSRDSNTDARNTRYYDLLLSDQINIQNSQIVNLNADEFSRLMEDLVFIAQAASQWGDYDVGTQHALRALEIAETRQNLVKRIWEERADAFQALGDIHDRLYFLLSPEISPSERMSNIENAVNHFESALDVTRKNRPAGDLFAKKEQRIISKLISLYSGLRLDRELRDQEKEREIAHWKSITDLVLESERPDTSLLKVHAPLLISALYTENNLNEATDYQRKLIFSYEKHHKLDEYFFLFTDGFIPSDTNVPEFREMFNHAAELMIQDELLEPVSSVEKAKVFALRGAIVGTLEGIDRAIPLYRTSFNYAREASEFLQEGRRDAWNATLTNLQIFSSEIRSAYKEEARSIQDFVNLTQSRLGATGNAVLAKVNEFESAYYNFNLAQEREDFVSLEREASRALEIIGMTPEEFFANGGGSRHAEYWQNPVAFDLTNVKFIELIDPKQIALIPMAFNAASIGAGGGSIAGTFQSLSGISENEQHFGIDTKYLWDAMEALDSDDFATFFEILSQPDLPHKDFSNEGACELSSAIASGYVLLANPSYGANSYQYIAREKAYELYLSMYSENPGTSNQCDISVSNYMEFVRLTLFAEFYENTVLAFKASSVAYSLHVENLNNLASAGEFHGQAVENRGIAAAYLYTCSRLKTYVETVEAFQGAESIKTQCEENALTAMDLALINKSTNRIVEGTFRAVFADDEVRLAVEEINKNRIEIERLNQNLIGTSTADIEEEWYQEILSTKQSKEVEIESLRNDMNLTDNSVRMVVDPFTINDEDYRSLISDTEVILVVQGFENSALSISLISQAGIVHRDEFAKDDEFNLLVEKVRESAELKPGVSSIGELSEYDVESAYRLYSFLFDSFQVDLEDIRVINVVTNTKLQALPLTLLITNDPESEDFELEQSWAYKKFNFKRLPSLRSVFALMDNGEGAKNDRSFLGVGDPVLADYVAGTRSIKVLGYEQSNLIEGILETLPSLPDTRDELEDLAGYFDPSPMSTLLMGEYATEEALRGLDLSNYSTIAFATHGLLSGQIPGLDEPALVMTPRNLDGLLTASEIAEMDLAAELVILSACNTNLDSRMDAEGLSGLSTAFLFAGVKSLMVTHWAVDSEVSAFITTSTIERYREEPEFGISSALGYAIDRVREQSKWDHPAIWAPFSVIGDRR